MHRPPYKATQHSARTASREHSIARAQQSAAHWGILPDEYKDKHKSVARGGVVVYEEGYTTGRLGDGPRGRESRKSVLASPCACVLLEVIPAGK